MATPSFHRPLRRVAGGRYVFAVSPHASHHVKAPSVTWFRTSSSWCAVFAMWCSCGS